MNHPRVLAILSAAVSSAAAFSVAEHWQLLGTVTGAALIAVVYNLVLHGFSQAWERTASWVKHLLRGKRAGDSDDDRSVRDSSSAETVAGGGEGETAFLHASPDQAAGRRSADVLAKTRGAWSQWAVAGLVLLALCSSGYALAAVLGSGDDEQVVFRDRVIEKVITVAEVTGDETAAPVHQAADAGRRNADSEIAVSETTCSPELEGGEKAPGEAEEKTGSTEVGTSAEGSGAANTTPATPAATIPVTTTPVVTTPVDVSEGHEAGEGGLAQGEGVLVQGDIAVSPEDEEGSSGY